MIKIDVRKSLNTNEDYSLFVSFPYDADIIDIIRKQPIRFWNKDTKEWELPLSSLENLVQDFSAYEIEINADSPDIFKVNTDIPADFEYKTKPFSHQEDALVYGVSHNKWLLGDEQGLGKTKEVIDIAIAKKLQYGYKHCLIICCVNSIKWNWLNEIAIHSNEKGWILGQYEKNNEKLAIGTNHDKYNDLRKLGHDPKLDSCYFLITNVESLRDADILNKLIELCANGTIGMVAADEIHLGVKNPSSIQGKAFLKLRADTMIAMTGTPLMNSPEDLYTPLKWLGVESHSFYSFRQHYCEFGGYGDYQVIGYKNLEELQKKLDNVMLRRRKADVLDLPEKIRISEYVEMTGKQEQIYKEVLAGIQANIDQIKAASNPLAELIRLRQATGYTGILSSMIKESAKLDRLVEIVRETIANGKKAIIFSNWTQVTDAVELRFADEGIYNYGVITGDTKDADRQEVVNAFQNGKLDVVIGTTGAMGTGLTLTAATVEIFMDEPWNRAKKEQAEDRAHRAGTTENVTIYTLLCKGTIDEKINDLVEKKGRVADMLVDGQIKMDKGELVDYLLS